MTYTMFNGTGALQRAELILMPGVHELGDVTCCNDMGQQLGGRNGQEMGNGSIHPDLDWALVSLNVGGSWNKG